MNLVRYKKAGEILFSTTYIGENSQSSAGRAVDHFWLYLLPLKLEIQREKLSNATAPWRFFTLRVAGQSTTCLLLKYYFFLSQYRKQHMTLKSLKNMCTTLQSSMPVTTLAGYRKCTWGPFPVTSTARDGLQEQRQWSPTDTPVLYNQKPAVPQPSTRTSCLAESRGQLQAALHQQPGTTSNRFSSLPSPQHRKGHMTRYTSWVPLNLKLRKSPLHLWSSHRLLKQLASPHQKCKQKTALYLLCQAERHLTSYT